MQKVCDRDAYRKAASASLPHCYFYFLCWIIWPMSRRQKRRTKEIATQGVSANVLWYGDCRQEFIIPTGIAFYRITSGLLFHAPVYWLDNYILYRD